MPRGWETQVLAMSSKLFEEMLCNDAHIATRYLVLTPCDLQIELNKETTFCGN